MFSKDNTVRIAYLLAAALIIASTLPHAANAQTGTPDATATNPWCGGVNIVFFPGGSVGGSFETVVYNGAVRATADLGPTTTYLWSDWDPQKMTAQFKQAVATKPDGIAIMGHPGDDAFKSLVGDAEKQGIIITSQNTTLPHTESTYRALGFGYSGADLYPQGEAVGNEALQRFKLKRGDRAMVWGLLSQPGRGQRTKGVIDILKIAGVKVDYIEISAAVNADANAGLPVFTDYVKAHPDVKAIITDHGNLTANLPVYLQAAGKKPGDIQTGGFDLSVATVQGIKDGWIGFVNDQQEWLQGYLPILQICLTKKFGFSGLHVDTGAGFVTSENVDILAALSKEGIR